MPPSTFPVSFSGFRKKNEVLFNLSVFFCVFLLYNSSINNLKVKKMTTVQIAYEVSNEKFKKIKDFLAQVAESDVNWNGATFYVERDDFTCITDDDGAEAVALLIEIQKIINNETE